MSTCEITASQGRMLAHNSNHVCAEVTCKMNKRHHRRKQITRFSQLVQDISVRQVQVCFKTEPFINGPKGETGNPRPVFPGGTFRATDTHGPIRGAVRVNISQ